jgi:catechol 2,3-dioxygenase-like lactoylglutathione lyase family enzyme
MQNEGMLMAKPQKFAHVVYRTRRFEEMISWYQTVFEAHVQYQNPLLAFLTYDDEHHRFAFVNLAKAKPVSEAVPPVPEQRSEVGVDHVAYTYANLGDLLETYARLKDAGIEPYWPVHHGVTVSLYYQDPDGNRIEFQIDCFADAKRGMDYMLGEEFASNPIGVSFDPDEFLKLHRNGTPLEKLLVRPAGPMAPIPRRHGM